MAQPYSDDLREKLLQADDQGKNPSGLYVVSEKFFGGCGNHAPAHEHSVF
jgi:hypothetical protein